VTVTVAGPVPLVPLNLSHGMFSLNVQVSLGFLGLIDSVSTVSETPKSKVAGKTRKGTRRLT
jgi:hypothetical protein